MASTHQLDIESTLARVSTLEYRGRITQALGTTVTVTGLPVAIGQRCRILNAQSATTDDSVLAEVVGFSGDEAVLFPLGDIRGITLGSEVVIDEDQVSITVDESLLGQTLNGFGVRVSKNSAPVTQSGWSFDMPVRCAAPEPLQRQRVSELFHTGVKAVDALLTVGMGQRLGIFAPAGAGKSTLLGQLSRSSPCDVVVIALIGERGREVREFLEDTLNAESREKSVLVVATSDRPAMERISAITASV